MRKHKEMIIALSALMILGVTGCNRDNTSVHAEVETNTENQENSTQTENTENIENIENVENRENAENVENSESNENNVNGNTAEDEEDGLEADHDEDKGTTYDSFQDVIDGLSEDQKYMYYQFEGSNEQILVVADGTYDNGDGTMVAISCQFFIKDDNGKIIDIGSVDSCGTAYPIAVNGSDIYVCGNHFAGKYILDKVTKELVLIESASEKFDDKGDASYSYMPEGTQEEQKVSDDSKLQALYDEYSKATPFNFK